MKNKKKIKMLTALLSLAVVFTMWPASISKAAEDGTAKLVGLEIGDTVEIYRICNYSEEDGYTFASAVSTWLKDTKAGNAYSGITPAKLSSMNAVNSKEFCEILLMGLKTASTGVANLPGESFEYKREDANTVALNPGYYIVLPKGYSRVYNIKWFKLEPASEITITYDEGDYSATSLTTSVENITKNRGKIKDKYPTVIYEDEIQVSSEIVIPQYNEMYTSGKIRINATVTLPDSVDLVQNSLKVYSAATSVDSGDGEEPDVEYVSLATDNYKVSTYEGAVLYKDIDGKIIFFGQNTYYFDMDGTRLVGPDATVTAAIEKYNESHGTEYKIENHEIEVLEAGDAEPEEETGTEESTETDGTGETTEAGQNENQETTNTSGENVVETSSINAESETTTKDKNLLTEYRGATVIVVSLTTKTELKKIKITVNAKKDEYASSDGWLDTITGLAYTVSPLDSNKLSILQETARAGSYGLRLTACLGNYESYKYSTEELLKTAIRMTDDEYSLYKKNKVYDGDIKDSMTNINSESSIQLVYDKTTGKTTEYQEIAKLKVDDEGQVSIGGLEQAEYLVIQTKCTYGYELSALSLLIDASDWENDEHMEGNCLMDFIWLNYETYLLPATGSSKVEVQETWAALIMMFAILAATRGYRKNKVLC